MFRRRKQNSEDQAAEPGDENVPPSTGSDSNDNNDTPKGEDDKSPQDGSPTESKGFFRGMFKGEKKRDPLTPPPECFSRPAQLPAEGPLPFNSFEVSCNGRLLDAGWALEYLADVLPEHDIQESEWVRFLEDLALTARLKPRDRIVSHVIPMAMGAGLYGILISNAVKRIIKRGKANGVASVVDIWNGCYFQLRGVKVTLMREDKTLSGLSADDDSSSSPDSSSDEDEENKDESRKERRERKKREKEERKERERLQKEQKDQEEQRKKELEEQQEKERQEQQEGEEQEEDKRPSPYYLVIEFQPIVQPIVQPIASQPIVSQPIVSQP